MKKLKFNLVFNPKKGFICQHSKLNQKECFPVAVGTFQECKKHADLMNRQFEKIW